MTSGRYLNEIDIEYKRKVCVIGQEVVKSLFEKGQDPLGKWIDINGILYKVVGTFKDEGSEREQQVIMIPISTAQMAYNGGNRVHMMMFTVGDATVAESEVMYDKTLSLLQERHKFSPEDERAVFMWNNLENFQRFKDLFAGINIFIWIVGLGTIVAGVVGVSNIMLIIVKDRTREIGIRKALGATPFSIISLIIQEAIVITLISGYFGLLFGVGLIEAVNWALNEFGAEVPYFRNPEIHLNTALTATVILVFAGAMAGYFPARKAATIQPIEALRDE
jgi:putative ABC transport system permease protein